MAGKEKKDAPLAFIWGDDDYSVKKRARRLYQQWCEQAGGLDHEMIDASVTNAGDALKALARVRASLDTLPFFGSAKVVWLQNCNFLGEDRVASSQAVTEALNGWVEDLKIFPFQKVKLLITAGKVDKRRTFYRSLEKIAHVENFSDLSTDDKGWVEKAEAWLATELTGLNKSMSCEAMAEFINCVGPNLRLLSNELEKLAIYTGDRREMEIGDIQAIVTRQKQARAFELADALGDRDLPRALRALEEALWEVKLDSQKSAIGLLYGLITKVRVLLFLKECLRAGWLKPENDFNRFKTQLDRLPADWFPDDKKLNPLAVHPYVLFRALPQARRYSSAELVQAMETLLLCNRRLIFSGLDESLVLQQTLVQILSAA